MAHRLATHRKRRCGHDRRVMLATRGISLSSTGGEGRSSSRDALSGDEARAE
jgi:hypothetical protein